MKPPRVAVICGPTASGKTAFATRVAAALKTEIICADSRQIYREMKIGTARPLDEEMRDIPHHLCACASIHDTYNAGQFQKDSTAIANALLAQHKTPVLVGGTGLYLKAFCEGLSNLPERNDELRESLSSLDIETLQQILIELDPEAGKLVDLMNPQRMIRAIELCKLSGKRLKELYEVTKTQPNFECVLIALEWERDQLYERINHRCDQMLEAGLLEEVKRLHPFKSLEALRTVGYQEFFSYLDGELSFPEAIELFKRNSRRYAKRQLTWLRNQMNVHWISAKSENALNQAIALIR